MGWTRERPGKNKANFRWCRVARGQGFGTQGKCAKQTQFFKVEVTHHSIMPSFQYSSPMPNERNKPNSRRGWNTNHRRDAAATGVPPRVRAITPGGQGISC